jgi:phosphoglycolate phosphatase-like HAD superfamily hydrolase
VVWDWNGTLFDDFALTARIGADSLAKLGVPDVTPDSFRDAFTRPFSLFYSRLLGHPVSDDEFRYIRSRYENEYRAAVLSLSLHVDATEALDHVSRSASQSILSMAPDEHLQPLIDHHRIRDRFVRIEGSYTGSSDGTKTASLCRHLESIDVEPASAVVIGDTVDDQEAAIACGASAVLVTGGSQSRTALEATGSPVVDTLLDAVVAAL